MRDKTDSYVSIHTRVYSCDDVTALTSHSPGEVAAERAGAGRTIDVDGSTEAPPAAIDVRRRRGVATRSLLNDRCNSLFHATVAAVRQKTSDELGYTCSKLNILQSLHACTCTSHAPTRTGVKTTRA